MNSLFLIPARGGSKGVPGKNIKLLGGKPLIHYAIDCAREITGDNNICVSTDDAEIIKVVEDVKLRVPFIRPIELASDYSSSDEVIKHALEFYESQGGQFDNVVLLQPTSPFRKPKHVLQALNLFTNDIDMVVSCKESSANPYFTLFEEDQNGFLIKSKAQNFKRRQDCPKVYEINGAVYIINVTSIKKEPMSGFKMIRKNVMDEVDSLDIDTPLDWEFCEFLIQRGLKSF